MGGAGVAESVHDGRHASGVTDDEEGDPSEQERADDEDRKQDARGHA